MRTMQLNLRGQDPERWFASQWLDRQWLAACMYEATEEADGMNLLNQTTTATSKDNQRHDDGDA